MAIEIERKFLVLNDNYKTECYKSYNIVQGFLNSDKNRVVRVRIADNKGFLTIKGLSSSNGFSRYEWEQEILLNEAESLLKLCEPGVIEKKRHLIKSNNHLFEIDEFYGTNKGLVIAEVELKSENETFEYPSWLGKEVTGDIKYYNAELKNNPFKNWA